jgi:hypothetical protein
MLIAGAAGFVLAKRNGARKVVGVPRDGWAFWEREPGADAE